MANLLPSLLASGFAPSGASPSRIARQLDALARDAESRDVSPPGWALLIELDDPGLVEELLARGIRVMLVLPQAWRVARLAEAVDDLNRPGLRLCGELLAAEQGEVCWYSYNDPRCDGTSSPQELQLSRPNLRLDALEMRPLHTLDSLRHAWIECDGPLEGEGVLLLSDAGQLELLAGADLLLNDLAALAWLGPGDAQTPASLAARFLAPWPEAEPGQWWRRDVALELRAECRTLQQLLARSTAQLEQLRAEREHLAQRQAELQGERDGLLQAQAEQAAQLALHVAQAGRLQQDHNTLLLQCAEQHAATEALQEDNRRRQEEAQRLSDQGLLLQEECLALQSELAALGGQLQVGQAGLAEALAERDQARAECDQLLAERGQLQAGMATLQTEAERLREDLHEALRARQQQQVQLAGLTDRAEHSSRELEALRQRLVLLIEAAAPPADCP